jgi:hypothetical protein
MDNGKSKEKATVRLKLENKTQTTEMQELVITSQS